MKAVICTKYGSPEVLKLAEVEKPIPKDREILVKIMASAVNSADVRVRSLDVNGFLKFIMRIVLGFNKPRKPILGVAFSGIIEQTGKGVTNFQIGDSIFGVTGFKFGTYAEYITLSDTSAIAKKPVNASFEEAAAIPFGGHTAIYFFDKAKIKEKVNPSILIYGATGSVGTAAIQIARHYKAHVVAVCSEKGKELALDLGADEVILYDKEDFTKTTTRFDIIFDAVGKISKKQGSPLLKKGGSYVTVASLESAEERKDQMEFLCKLFENGEYKAVIDRTFSLDEIVEAHKYVDTGHKKGNVVIRIHEN